jgi:hypothetical protein
VNHYANRFFILAVTTLTVALAVAARPGLFDGAVTLANPGPDLIVESIQISPSIPGISQTVYLTFTVRNVGNANIVGIPFENWIYIDPVDRPPTSGTAKTAMWGIDTLNAGASSTWFRTKEFTSTGCDHVVYAWADHGNKVSEDIETNNVVSTTVCVGVTGAADIYEPDDTCGAARWITNTVGIPQHHTLWPVGDADWVKFSAVAGVTYTIEAKNLGIHANPVLYLYTSCGSLWQFGTGSKIVWQAPASGVYYVEVADGSPTHGPMTGYDLSVSADSTGLYDPYEPDGTCMAARDISTDGAPQTHFFQVVGDEDWVKFPMQSGETYVVVAGAPGPNVSPQVALYNSCGMTFGAPMAQGPSPQVESAAPGVLYARATNLGTGFGPTAHYDLSVSAITCVPDGQEPDGGLAQARGISSAMGAVTHNFCPAGDRDWVKFNAISGTTYVLETSNLGPASDTEITLYGTDGVTELARNDDWTAGLLSSRIVWQAPANGIYPAMVRHVKEGAAGANTRYDLTLSQGICTADAFDTGGGDNGPLNASLMTLNGPPQQHNLCPRGDQDWGRIVVTTPGTRLELRTSGLAPGADTVLYLYDRGGNLLAFNDDFGPGGASMITYTAVTSGAYYVQALNFDTNDFGAGTAYSLSVAADAPPTPTPSPTPTKTPTPTPAPTPPPTTVHTLILTNRQRVEDLYSADESWQLMSKLYQLADHPRVAGAVVQVELDPAVATSYAAWTANSESLLDVQKANDVASAIRNLILAYRLTAPSLEYLVIVGDDRVIPFRRITDYTGKRENQYAANITISTTQWAAAQAETILADDYYADVLPTTWTLGELYLPDYAVGRLVETPQEIMAFVDAFLASGGAVGRDALVTGYAFVDDTAETIGSIVSSDSITKATLIGSSWVVTDLRTLQLQTVPRFDIQSVNGHSTHMMEKTPDGSGVSAAEIASSTVDLAGVIVYSVGCHAGLNDTGSLDLAQAFAQKGANYVANTGYGWGGGGTTWSEALMRNYTLSLLQGLSTTMGNALVAAKAAYVAQSEGFDSYDHKVLQEATFYGLPMWVITTGASFNNDNPFPGVHFTPTLPSGSFGRVNTGTVSFGLAGSFGGYDQITNTHNTFFSDGSFFAINNSIQVGAGQPVQPKVFADLSAPAAGTLRSVVFLGGIYTDVQGFTPVVPQPFNEYVTPTQGVSFTAPGWFPPTPFGVQHAPGAFGGQDTLVTVMGQYNSSTGVERLYDHMSFDSYYSVDPDLDPPRVTKVGGVLNEAMGRAFIKVEATDDSGVGRVVVAFTHGQGQWFSRDLAFDPAMQKWTGEITATRNTLFFVQAMDGAGNLQVADNKGAYYALPAPAPLVAGEGFRRIYLPLVVRGAAG